MQGDEFVADKTVICGVTPAKVQRGRIRSDEVKVIAEEYKMAIEEQEETETVIRKVV